MCVFPSRYLTSHHTPGGAELQQIKASKASAFHQATSVRRGNSSSIRRCSLSAGVGQVQVMMSFSPSSYMSFSLSPPAAHREDHAISQHSLSGSVPFLLYPSSMDPYKASLRGPGPGLLPYLTPFHHHGHFSVYECPYEPAFIQKRNERERQRVRCVNQGYAKLRDHLPGQSADKRLSKVETLRAAIRYIKYLQGLVELEDGTLNASSPGPDCGGV